jgi:site-specific DNA-adenine methylase
MVEQKILDILKNYKNSSNKDLVEAMEFLNDDFQKTKDLLVTLTYHLDSTESAYDKVFEEYKKRMNNGQ